MLTNGFQLRADRIEQDGDTLRLTQAGGEIRIPLRLVQAIEIEPPGIADPIPAARTPAGTTAAGAVADAGGRAEVAGPNGAGLAVAAAREAAQDAAARADRERGATTDAASRIGASGGRHTAALDGPRSNPAGNRARAAELVEQAALRYRLPPAFLHSVARAESAYRADAVSPKGALGIMQLMPGTAAELQADPSDPEQNVDAGARHLRDLLRRYHGSAERALAAYNAGAGAVERYKGVPPYRETRLYVDRILRNYLKAAGAPNAAGAAE